MTLLNDNQKSPQHLERGKWSCGEAIWHFSSAGEREHFLANSWAKTTHKEWGALNLTVLPIYTRTQIQNIAGKRPFLATPFDSFLQGGTDLVYLGQVVPVHLCGQKCDLALPTLACQGRGIHLTPCRSHSGWAAQQVLLLTLEACKWRC